MLLRFFALLLLLLLGGCHPPKWNLEPKIHEPPHKKEIFRETRAPMNCVAASPSPFSPLTEEELSQDWGKEYWIGLCLAADFDLYRAITGFKRALLLCPKENKERRLEIEYQMTLSYYLGKKYQEATYQFECSGLVAANETFPAFTDLLLLLYDSYAHLGNEVQACHILGLLEKQDADKAEKLRLLAGVERADLSALYEIGINNPNRSYLETIVCNYRQEALSVKKAQMLNTLLPGAGYWYVGQKETAVTAFIVNGLFIAASACFFQNGNIAAGTLALSLESGWYIGGIWGAGLSAKYYNERLYERYADKITAKEKYFPIMMLRYTF